MTRFHFITAFGLPVYLNIFINLTSSIYAYETHTIYLDI